MIRHSALLEELINLSYHIALDNMDAANRFLDACEETFHDLARTPYIGSVREFEHPALKMFACSA